MEHVGEIEKQLWSVADHLRANSNFASNEYFLPVMGLIFLRHAYSRFLRVQDDIKASLSSRGGVTRPLTKEDFSQRGSIFLKPEAQFDHLFAITGSRPRSDRSAPSTNTSAIGSALPKAKKASCRWRPL